MGLFGGLLKLAVDTVTLPISVVKDSLNIVTGEEPEAIIDNCENIGDDVEEIFDI